ncbi:uncharacterized protein ACN427_009594 isoform 1-T1 [Glossina fuscipes fuscipes]
MCCTNEFYEFVFSVSFHHYFDVFAPFTPHALATTASLSGTDGSPANNLLAAVFHDTVPGTSLADIVPPSPQGIANHAAKVAGTVPVQGPTPTNARPPPAVIMAPPPAPMPYQMPPSLPPKVVNIYYT